jgi:hypothetical protein
VSSTIEALPSATSVHQTSYGWLCDALRGAARGEASGPGIDAIGCRATGALNALLAAHPVDRRGRCRSCRRPGALLGRGRRTCLIYWTAHYWLLQPVEALRFRLDPEVQVHGDASSPSHTVDRDVTDAQPQGAPGSSGQPPRRPIPTPVVPPPLPPRRCPRAGRPDPDHGGTGVYSDNSPRSRRVPPRNPVTGPTSLGRSLLLAGDKT